MSSIRIACVGLILLCLAGLWGNAGQAQEVNTPKDDRKAGDPMKLTIKGVEYAFRWCPSGTFLMGNPPDEYRGDPVFNVNRSHQVKLSRGFWMLETEVTQAMWESIVGNNPSQFKGVKLPVEEVTWNDCQEYIKKLNNLKVAPAGYRFSLPTEAQWEYACRAGTTTAYHFGNDLTKDQANIEQSVGHTTDVGKYPANTWGLHDMHGNVKEWCADWWGQYPSDVNPDTDVTDPVGPPTGEYRVYRGGTWGYDGSGFAKSAHRNCGTPSYRDYRIGLRLSLVSE